MGVGQREVEVGSWERGAGRLSTIRVSLLPTADCLLPIRPGLPSRATITRFCALLAPVAQLDRAPDYESGGRRFESFRARHAVLLQTRCRDWALESAALPRFSRAIARRTGRRDSPNMEILAPSVRQSLSSETRPPLRPRT